MTKTERIEFQMNKLQSWLERLSSARVLCGACPSSGPLSTPRIQPNGEASH